jgi:hypothetical protein
MTVLTKKMYKDAGGSYDDDRDEGVEDLVAEHQDELEPKKDKIILQSIIAAHPSSKLASWLERDLESLEEDEDEDE